MKIQLWKYWILTFLFFNASSSLLAQCASEDSLSIFHYYFSQARHFILSDPQKSIDYCDSIISTGQKQGCPVQALEGLLFKIESIMVLGDFSRMKENLILLEERILNSEIKDADKIRNLKVRGKENWAFYYREIGKQNKCLKILDGLIKYLDTLPNLNQQDSLELRKNYVIAGSIYRLKGDHEKALSYFLEGRQLNNQPRVYASYIAALYAAKKDYETAKIYYREYFLPNKNIKRNKNLFSNACRGMANVYVQENRPDSALFYLQESLKFIKPAAHNYYRTFYLMGEVYLTIGDYPLARKCFNIALEKMENSLSSGKEHLNAPIHQGIGETHLQEGKLEEALGFFQLAMINLVPGFDEIDIHQNPPLDNPNIYRELLGAFEKKINALYQLQQKDPTAFQNITFETTLEAIALIDSIRLDYFGEEDKQFLLAQSYSIFEKAIDLAVTRGAYKEAFELSEKSKALVLYDAMKIKRAQALTALKDDLLIEKKQIEKQLMKWQQALQRAKNKEDEKSIQDAQLQVFKAKKSFAAVLTKMKKNPAFKTAFQEISIADLVQSAQEKLARNQVLLEFFKGEKYLYAFLIRGEKNAIEVQRIEWTDDLENSIVQFNALIKQDDRASEIRYEEEAQFLYKKLLAPSLGTQLPKSLILIPDGILAYLPFAALITEEVKKEDARKFKNHAYLGKQVALCQWFSVAASTLSEYAEPNKKWNTDLLAYAPSFLPLDSKDVSLERSSEDGAFSPLLFNKQEINFIAENIKSSTLMVDSQANKKHFLRNGPNSRILHFATHGKVDTEQPKRSYIAFSNLVDTVFQLGLNELYHMNLSAEMVVLSACETGLGKIVKGEGTLSIARGFIYAGARSVLTTLWSTNDQTTCDLMKQFYEELGSGYAKDEALRLAVNHYLKDLAPVHKQAHPRYWAAFTAIGDMEEINLGTDNHLKWALLILALCLFFGCLYFRGSKKSRLVQ